MKQLTFNLPDDLAQKFELAIELTGANRDAVAEEFVRGYLANALQSAANQYKTPDPVQPSPAPAQTPFRPRRYSRREALLRRSRKPAASFRNGARRSSGSRAGREIRSRTITRFCAHSSS